jgi:hypothetical protein
MPLDDTLEEHRMAGVSLRNGMHERVRLVTSAFANERCCALGRWIHEDGATWDEVPEFQQLRMAHASFHTVALVVALSITQKRFAEATIMLEPDAVFESAARMLAHALSRFEKRRVMEVAPAPHGRTDGDGRTDGYIKDVATHRSLHDSGLWQLICAVSGEH